MRVLLDNLNEPNPTTQILVLEVFIQIFKSEQMKQTWSDFVELITLRIINAHSSDKREVSFHIVYVKGTLWCYFNKKL